MPPLPASVRCALLAALVRAHVAAQTDVAREMQAAESGRKFSFSTDLVQRVPHVPPPETNPVAICL